MAAGDSDKGLVEIIGQRYGLEERRVVAGYDHRNVLGKVRGGWMISHVIDEL